MSPRMYVSKVITPETADAYTLFSCAITGGRHPMARAKCRKTEASALACDIVADAFGYDCGVVCRALARRGSMTLRELVRDTVLFSLNILCVFLS